MKKIIKIATRQSPLALWQANFIKNELTTLYPDLDVMLHTIKTKGDKLLDTPLAKIGGKGLFLKELEVSLLEKETDIAVHSMKDVPVEFPDGLKLAVICERENPQDAFVSNKYSNLNELPANAILGTCSLRRQAQIKALRPDIEIHDLRGNVNTRLKKLDNGEYDAIILAAAGLIRLKMEHRIKLLLPLDISLPAIGQGAVGIECRSDDNDVLNLIKPLADQSTTTCLTTERALNKRLEGGCQVPIAGYAQIKDGKISCQALVASLDGTNILRASGVAEFSQAEQLGIQIAENLLNQGADKILSAVYSANQKS